MTSSIDTASKPWRLNSRRALRTILGLVRWRCSAGYDIELPMGCENTASQNMFLNISKCYLNILFVSLIPNVSTTCRQLTESSLTATIFPQATGEDCDAPITHPFKRNLMSSGGPADANSVFQTFRGGIPCHRRADPKRPTNPRG